MEDRQNERNDDVFADAGNVLAVYRMGEVMGKGSGRRPGDGYAANWDAIFGKRKSDEKTRAAGVPAPDGEQDAPKRDAETKGAGNEH